MPSGIEIFVIFMIILLLFGAKKIPQLAKSLGKATKEFKDAKNSFNDALHEPEKHETYEQPQPSIAPPLEEDELEEKPKAEAKAESPKSE